MMNIQAILNLGIQNIAKVSDNIVRGETLWAARNRKFILLLRNAGVVVISPVNKDCEFVFLIFIR